MNIQKNITMPVLIKYLLFLLSFLVFIAPFPFFSFFVPAFLLIILTGKVRFSSSDTPVWIFLALYTIVSLISLINAIDMETGLAYFRFSIYLCLLMLFVSALIYSYGYEPIGIIFKGSTFLILISAIASLAGLFGILPIYDQVTLWDRLSGFCGNPNYYGLALNFCVMYLYYKMGLSGKIGRIKNLAALMLLVFTLLLTYSRAGWIGLVVSIICYSFFIAVQSQSKTALLRFIAGIIGLIVFIGSAWLVADAFDYTERIRMRFEAQEYDVDRFMVHDILLEKSLEHPLGVGPGQISIYLSNFYNNIKGADAAESSYLEVLFERGYMGEALYLLLLVYLLFLSFRISLFSWEFAKISAAVTSIFYGMLVFSFIGDTTYFLHFWIISGMICGLNILYSRERELRGRQPVMITS